MRITRCFIVIALMALVSPAMAAPCAPGQRADLTKLGYEQADIKEMCGNASALFERAYNKKESGNLRTAQQLFEQGLRIEPGNTLGQRLLAEVKESLSSAQKLFEHGYKAKQSGDLQSAQQLFEQGLRIEPGNELGQKYLAVVKESLSSAQKLFEQAYNAKQSGDLRIAQQLFEQGLRIEPGNSLGQKYLAEVKEEATRPTASPSVPSAGPPSIEQPQQKREVQPNIFGEGGIVVATGTDGKAPIYESDSGVTTIAYARNRDSVSGISGSFPYTLYRFARKNGRVRVTFFGPDARFPSNGWMNESDLSVFTFSCACETQELSFHDCSPLRTTGILKKGWNSCFVEASDKKRAEPAP